MSIGPARSYGLIIPKANYITSLVRQGTISKEAAKRLRWMDHYNRYRNARLTCRYYGISPQTFYRWKNRYDRYDLRTLESGSHRPYKVRQSETPVKVIERIQKLREQYPRWGRDKLSVLLMKEGIEISASTVGRVINRLKARGLLREPENVRLAKLARKRRRKPRYAVRMPKGYSIEAPGDLVQMDTLKLQLMSNDVRYHFSARDVVSRWDCARAFRRQTSFAAARFLEYLETKFPFKIKAIQIDGGSEFMKDFEEAIQERQILLFVIPPRSPKLNSYVERANRMHREEFYEVETIGHTMEEHNRQLERWQYTYNYVRPHQALDYLTPAEYHKLWLESQRAKRH
ncbi:MAG: integrase core domain-containing protein [Candidatus Aminicenantaceae bacterium]